MRNKKIAAAALAAVLAFGAVSAASFAADDDEIREESKYEITLEKATVEGEEKAAVIFKGLPKEAFTFEYAHTDETLLGEDNGKNVIRVKELEFAGIYVGIGDKDGDLSLSYQTTFERDELGEYTKFEWKASNGKYDDNREEYPMTSEEEGNTITLTVYLDLDNANLKDWLSEEKIVVTTYANLYGSSGACIDEDNDGHISDDENDPNAAWGVGDAFEYVPIYSNEKIALHTSDKWDATAKEYVKITNNISIPETSNPTTSEPETSNPTTSNPTTSTPATSETTSSDTSDPTTSEPTTSEPATSEPTTSEPNSEAPATTPNEFKPTLTDESLDEETKAVLGGITVTDNNGAFEDDVVMNVTATGQTGNSFSFDITFTKDGKEVQPKGTVTVKVPVPEFLKNGDIYVYHYDENGNATLVSSKVEDGFVIFEADHFSRYALSNKMIGAENSEANTPESSTTTTSETNNPNPNTGIGYALFPIFAMASAAIVISKKKK